MLSDRQTGGAIARWMNVETGERSEADAQAHDSGRTGQATDGPANAISRYNACTCTASRKPAFITRMIESESSEVPTSSSNTLGACLTTVRRRWLSGCTSINPAWNRRSATNGWPCQTDETQAGSHLRRPRCVDAHEPTAFAGLVRSAHVSVDLPLQERPPMVRC